MLRNCDAVHTAARAGWHFKPTGNNNNERVGAMVSQGTESHEATGRTVSSSSHTGTIKIKRRWTEMGMWHTSVIPALRKLRQENYKLRLAWTIE